jgi:cbb3-type cytochrome oxidase maturation protein
MTVLLILIPVALLLGTIGLAAFLWALRSGQFDDLDGAGVRILEDEDSSAELTPARQSERRPNEMGRRPTTKAMPSGHGQAYRAS